MALACILTMYRTCMPKTSIFCCSQLVFTEAEKNENFNTKIIRHISFLVARRFRFARSSDIYNLFDIPALTGPKAAGLATSNMYHVIF